MPPPPLDDGGSITNVFASACTSTGISGVAPSISAKAEAGVREGQRTMSPLVGGKQSVTGRGSRIEHRVSSLPEPMSAAAGQADRPIGGGLGGLTVVAEECLVVSGALDQTLCVFRARFGQGLSLLRRLNVACSPRGLPGALIVGAPVGEANGGIEGTQLEVINESGLFLGAQFGSISSHYHNVASSIL